MEKTEARRVLEQHFKLLNHIKNHYKRRNENPDYLDKAARCCEKQILLAPRAAEAFMQDRTYKQCGLPAHTGYEQLAIIREKEARFSEAIELCSQAKQQGWGAGCTKGPVDWDKRINRCSKKLAKSNPAPSVTPGLVHVTCTSCGRVLIIADKYAGQQGKCNHCGGLVAVPS